jgi:protein-S-isoprenylcysteine O-methyltransferase Ste14
MLTYKYIILFCWAAFLLVWLVLAFNVKRDIRGDRNPWQQYWFLPLVAVLVLIFAAARVAAGAAHFTNSQMIIYRSIFPLPPVLGWFAAVLTVLGVSFAIWARLHLGRNWSSRPTAKEHHELVTTGPYAYVRHPIYTGLIFMALGTALTGSIWGISVFFAASIIFTLRIAKEEKIMLELFPNEYPGYQKRTKRLVPFVW